MDTIRVETPADGVALLVLDDPGRRNAIGERMAAEIMSTVADLRSDEGLRVLVVTGAGPAFCAGADLPMLFGDPSRPVTAVHQTLADYYRVFFNVLALPIPTIAAVNGPAVGAGLNLALSCDLRVAGRAARFGATFARIGLHPGGGATWFLVRALGPSRALRTLLLGDTLDARKAVDWGLAEGPHDDPVAAALDLAGRIAAVDVDLARSIKRAVALAVSPGDLDAVVAYETWAQAASASSPVLQEWVERFR